VLKSDGHKKGQPKLTQKECTIFSKITALALEPKR
jgi:hypothetical protein